MVCTDQRMRVGQTCMSLSLSRGWHLKFKWVSRRQHARVWRHASIMWSLHCVQTNACVWDGHACHCHCENFWCQPMLLVQRMHVEQTCKSLSLWEVIDVNVGMRVRLVLLPSLHIEGIGAGKIKQDDSHCLIQLYTEFHPSHSPSHLHCTYSTWIIWENMNFVWFQKSLIISWNNIWHFIFCRQAAVRPTWEAPPHSNLSEYFMRVRIFLSCPPTTCKWDLETSQGLKLKI